MDRRHFVASVGATIVAGPAHASIAVDRFGPMAPGRSVILLHGSDGLTNGGRYEFAAQMIVAAGYSVWLPRYFQATGDRRARHCEIKTKFPIWLEAIEAIKVERQDRFAVVGFSLGGALALALAARDSRVKAVVDFFGFLPAGLERASFPPTLILHGDADRVVPVSNAGAIEKLIKSNGGQVQSHIYPDEGHGLSVASWPDAISRTQAFLREHL
ncbi:dienelactone hydrolase family protein [Bosea sp. 47.2.35]|jgi:carboxymethylenebutenolidase|uniref:dienelactone hydrolase family protein n=1 Tax=Bosea sp. 47.2.35 TaxID=2969304 RepID=UPI00214FF3CE|nr:alpha/beta fold hydrolase [Bosea sp. 47.2.35]MCR4522994.1 dienelactone hydrolase family protein [Bosea sp. 47.2.35]